MHPGAKPDFASVAIYDEWLSDKLNPWLRPVVVIACLLYHEEGSSRCKITKILGEDPPYLYGRAMDLGVLSLPRVQKAGPDEYSTSPAWITKRLNLLFPFGDGEKSTADYDGCVITIEVPPWGYMKHSMPLHGWNEWGSTGRVLSPRKVRI